MKQKFNEQLYGVMAMVLVQMPQDAVLSPIELIAQVRRFNGPVLAEATIWEFIDCFQRLQIEGAIVALAGLPAYFRRQTPGEALKALRAKTQRERTQRGKGERGKRG